MFIHALVLISALTSRVSAHERMRGPLPELILQHADDVSQLKKYAELDVQDSAKGLFGLHYYYLLDSEAQRLTLKLLDSGDEQAQVAAIGIIGHCGGETENESILRAISTRLNVLGNSKDKRVRQLARESKRSLRRRIKERRKDEKSGP